MCCAFREISTTIEGIVMRSPWERVVLIPRSRAPLLPWFIGALTLGFDQLSKWAIVRSFEPGASLPLLPPWLSLTYVQNTGAAFGLFKGQQTLFIVLSVCVIVWVGRQFTIPDAVGGAVRWAFALVVGGASGNLIDRVRLGYVIDFLDLHWWPVFNIGDSAITVGVAILILHSLLRSRGPVTSDK